VLRSLLASDCMSDRLREAPLARHRLAGVMVVRGYPFRSEGAGLGCTCLAVGERHNRVGTHQQVVERSMGQPGHLGIEGQACQHIQVIVHHHREEEALDLLDMAVHNSVEGELDNLGDMQRLIVKVEEVAIEDFEGQRFVRPDP
jgi:hypothetical protein